MYSQPRSWIGAFPDDPDFVTIGGFKTVQILITFHWSILTLAQKSGQAHPAEVEGCTAKYMYESIKYLYLYIIAASRNRNFLNLHAHWGKKKDKNYLF